MKKMRLIVAILAVCLLTGCKAEQYMIDGVNALEAKSYQEAITLFEAAIEADVAETGDAYKGIGLAYFEQGAYEQAVNMLNTALEKGAASSVEIYHMTGICYMNLEDYQSALNAFENGLELAADEETAYAVAIQEMRYNEIVCYEKLLDWKMALEKAEGYLQFYPEDQAVQKEAQFLRTR